MPGASSKELLKFKNQIKNFFKLYISKSSVESKYEKVDINNIKYCHHYSELLFLN